MAKLRLCAFNVENLFVFMEDYRGQDLACLSERQWQALTYGQTPNKKLAKLFQLAQTIVDIDADIFLLSEVAGLHSLENFNRYFLADSYEIFHQEGNSPRGIDVAFLLRKGLPYRRQLVGHREREILLKGKNKKSKFSRDLLELNLFRPKQKRPALVLLLVHLKSKLSRPDDFEGTDQRSAEVDSLIDYYLGLKKKWKGPAPVVIGGDMNAIATRNEVGPEFERLYAQTDLVDLHDLKNSSLKERCTYVHFAGGRQQLNQLDYLFLPPTLVPAVVADESFTYRYKNEMGEILPLPKNRQERAQLPSDHYPLILTLNMDGDNCP